MTAATETPLPSLEELRDRLRKIAPEVRAGDKDALAEFERIEATIAEQKRRDAVTALADAELAARAKAEAEAAAERQRERLRAEIGEREKSRAAALAKAERAAVAFAKAAEAALAEDVAVRTLLDRIEPGSGGRGSLPLLVENRAVRLLHAHLGRFGVRPGVLLPNEGKTPLDEIYK